LSEELALSTDAFLRLNADRDPTRDFVRPLESPDPNENPAELLRLLINSHDIMRIHIVSFNQIAS